MYPKPMKNPNKIPYSSTKYMNLLQKDSAKIVRLMPETHISSITLLEKVSSLKLLIKMPKLVQIMAKVFTIERSLMVRSVYP